MIPEIVGVPIKPFGVAKSRLRGVVDAAGRSHLGRAVAGHTIRAVSASGAEPAVVTGDSAVARWARENGWRVIDEPPRRGLDGAAGAVVTAVAGAWAVVHADLPVVTPDDLAVVWAALGGGIVLAPSRDGGTNVVAGTGAFRFAYGPGSFQRHLSTAPRSAVVSRPGLALDLDTPADLAVARALPSGGWLADVLAREGSA